MRFHLKRFGRVHPDRPPPLADDAGWIGAERRPFSDYSAGSLVPVVFARYARILHPAWAAPDVPVRWDAVARWSGRTIHPLAQWELLSKCPAMSESAEVVRLRDMSSDAAALELHSRAGAARTSETLEVLYLAHHEAVFRYLRAMSRDEDRALDLAATTFERAFAELRAGREPGIGWLLRTARNAAIDAERRSRTAALFRRRSVGAEATAPSPEEHTIDTEQAARVRVALASLPPPQRDAIALRYTSDLTVREIADVIGKSASATQKLLDRGLARLKESLHDLA